MMDRLLWAALWRPASVSIAEAHGGTLPIESGQRGAVVSFTLPFVEGHWQDWRPDWGYRAICPAKSSASTFDLIDR
jgi:hypothetical protein